MDNTQHTHPTLTGGQFAVIGGSGPKYAPEIQGGHKGLEQYLAERGFKYEQTHGKYEPSFIVHNIPRDQAMEIGRKAGQESIVHSNIGQHELVYVNGPQAGKHHPGTGHQFFQHPPQDSGAFLHIPNAGYVRFGFDTSKLLDVPKKGQDMLHTKNEVTVADFKKALAKSLQKQIDKYSASLVELAKTEVANSNGRPTVGDLRLTKSDFSIEIPDTVCPTCFQEDSPESCACLSATGLTKSAFGLTVAAAMKRVYDSYHRNVALPMFPNEPQKAHEIAMQVATDWATRVKDPRAIQTMALGHAANDYGASEHTTTPTDPDSMSLAPIPPKPPGYALVDEATAAKLGVPFKGGNYAVHGQHGNVTTNPGATLHTPDTEPSLEPVHEDRPARDNWNKNELDKNDNFKAKTCPTCGDPSSIHRKYRPHCTSCGSAKEEDHYDARREEARERAKEDMGKAELGKSFKSKAVAVGAAAALGAAALAGGTASTPSDKEIKAHTSKFTQDKENQPPVNPREHHKTEGEPEMCKTCKSEMCKCMGKGEKKPVKPVKGKDYTRANTPENLANRRKVDDAKDDAKREEWASQGYDTTIKNIDWKAELDKSDDWMKKSLPPGFDGNTMVKLEVKYGAELAKTIAWAAYEKKHHLAKGEIAGRKTCPNCKGYEVYVDSTDSTASSCNDCGHKWDLTYPGSTKPAPKSKAKGKLKKGAEEYADLDIGNSPHYKSFYDLAIKHGYPHNIAHLEAVDWMKHVEARQTWGDGWAATPTHGMERAAYRATPNPKEGFGWNNQIKSPDAFGGAHKPAIQDIEETVNTLPGREHLVPRMFGSGRRKAPEWPQERPPQHLSETYTAMPKGGTYAKDAYGKAEMVIDGKNAGARPTSTDQAKTGAPRLKNEGYENDKPAEPTKPIKGKVDEGSGGDVTKGKGMKKDELANFNAPGGGRDSFVQSHNRAGQQAHLQGQKAAYHDKQMQTHAGGPTRVTHVETPQGNRLHASVQPSPELHVTTGTPLYGHGYRTDSMAAAPQRGQLNPLGPTTWPLKNSEMPAGRPSVQELRMRAHNAALNRAKPPLDTPIGRAETQEVGSEQIVPPSMPTTQKSMAKAGPPMAQPPGGGTGLTPPMPKQSKPGAAKPIATAPTIAKPPKPGAAPQVAGAAKSEMVKADVVGAARIDQASKQPITPTKAGTAVPHTLSPGVQAVAGKGNSGLALDTKPKTFGQGHVAPTMAGNPVPQAHFQRSESQFPDLKKSLGSCLNCGKSEHPGVCNAT